MKNFLELLLFFALSLPLVALPHIFSKKAGEIIGLLAFRLWGTRRRIAIKNLRAAVERGELSLGGRPYEAAARDNFKAMGRSIVEVIKLYYGKGEEILGSVRIEGIENYHRAETRGKGVLFITGHCGNWEMMALALSSKVKSGAVVARPLNNALLNRLLERARRKFGNSVIYKKGALRNILLTLKSGGCVGILMDQAVVPEEGVVIDFLGAPAWTTRMPAAVAKKTGAAAIPVFIRRLDGGHEIIIHPEVELRGNDAEDTKRLSGFIEEYIKENPSEWLWIHRRWKRT